jgi:glycosyltransferase involved in cell wall biosynthesis
MVTISAVMPVHNEEKYLRYSLSSLKHIESEVEEWLFVLDNCNDNSEKLIRSVFPSAKLHSLQDWHSWQYKFAEVFQYCFNHATEDVIWALGADLVFDTRIPKLIRHFFADPLLGIICFRNRNYDLLSTRMRVQGLMGNLYRNILEKMFSKDRFTGIYAFRRSIIKEVGGLRDVPAEYDDFCRRIKRSRWKFRYEPTTHNLHLRTGLSRSKQYWQGRVRSYLPQYSLLKIIVDTLLQIKPHLLIGYLHENSRGKNHNNFDN